MWTCEWEIAIPLAPRGEKERECSLDHVHYLQYSGDDGIGRGRAKPECKLSSQKDHSAMSIKKRIFRVKISLGPRSYCHITLGERMYLLHALVLEERRARSNLVAQQRNARTLSSAVWMRDHPKPCGISDITWMPWVPLVASSGIRDLIRCLNWSSDVYSLKYMWEDKLAFIRYSNICIRKMLYKGKNIMTYLKNYKFKA